MELRGWQGLIAQLGEDRERQRKRFFAGPIEEIAFERIERAIGVLEAVREKVLLGLVEQRADIDLGEERSLRVESNAQAVVAQQAHAEGVKGADGCGGEAEA